jgi:anthranilate phosphoribosyltransferase
VENAQITRAILAGESGPKRDIVVLNAAAALFVAEAAAELGAGIELARQSIDSGAAAARLEQLIRATAAFAGRD